MIKTRILLADDHAVVRAGIRKAIEELAIVEVVGEAFDGPSLLAAIEEHQPGCLVIDVTMPDFAPVVTIRKIKAQYPDIKILIVSAYDDDIYVQGLLQVGVNGYHLKDQPLSDLCVALERVISGERWISSPLVDKLVHYSKAPGLSSLLTTRQRDILSLLQQGLDNKSIAGKLKLSTKTVENHLTRLYRLLGVQSRLEAVNYVSQHPETLAVSGQEASQISHASPPLAETMSLLLVDDNARYRHQLRRMIGKIYAQCIIYESDAIDDAVQLSKQIDFKLVFVDVILGEQNGIHCVSRIHAVSPSSRIILISAYPDREFHRQGLKAGAIAFLDKKELDSATLREILEDIAGRSSKQKAL